MTEQTEQEQLAEMLDRLRRLIAKSHARSHTAEQARNLITSVSSPSCPLSTAAKLRTVRDTLRSYKDGLQYSDLIRHHPGDRHRDE
jgi:hypothetical protein